MYRIRFVISVLQSLFLVFKEVGMIGSICSGYLLFADVAKYQFSFDKEIVKLVEIIPRSCGNITTK